MKETGKNEMGNAYRTKHPAIEMMIFISCEQRSDFMLAVVASMWDFMYAARSGNYDGDESG
jgi:hypothetical protein